MTQSPARAARSWRRRLGFALATCLLVLALCELIARFGMSLLDSRKWAEAQTLLAESGIDDDEYGEVLHPFTGYCHDPFSSPGADFSGRHVPVNRLGFFGEDDPVQTRSDDKLIIGIVGGSFAWAFGFEARDELVRSLQADPRLAGREVVIVNLALPGFKQPQQVTAFNYVAALGGEFDILINLDGFNELALSAENFRGRVFSVYPQGWIVRVHDVPDNRRLTESYRVFAIRSERQRMARAVLASPLRGLALRQVWWRLADKSLERRLHSTVNGLHAVTAEEGKTFAAAGPREARVPLSEVYPHSADVWSRCSRQLHAVATAQGARYLHAIQPNQYLEGSKPLSPEEAKHAVDAGSDFSKAVSEGYPLLQERGLRLQAEGIEFVDLTQVYADQPQTLYVDWCCHVNREGYEIIAHKLVVELLARWDEAPLQP